MRTGESKRVRLSRETSATNGVVDVSAKPTRPMSRRKQSNPKPAKRDSEIDEIADVLELPSELLFLKASDSNVTSYTVHAKIELKEGTHLGRYKGEIRTQDTSQEDGRASLQVNCSDGPPLHVMLEDEGHWLKFMRVAEVPSNANVFLHISGSDVVCTVTSDISREVELRVTCRIDDQGVPPTDPSKSDEDLRGKERCEAEGCHPSERAMLDLPGSRKEDEEGGDGKSLSEEAKIKEEHSDSSNSHGEGYFALGSVELEARDQSTRDSSTLNELKVQSLRLSVSPSAEPRNPTSELILPENKTFFSEDSKFSKDKPSVYSSDDESPEKRMDDSHSDAKVEGRCFQCPHCPYYSYRHYIFMRHLRNHDRPTRASSPSPPKTSPSQTRNPHMDRYCKACNIQFMSIKTYQVHKQFYCNSRHDISGTSGGAILVGDIGDASVSDETVSSAASGIKATIAGAGSVIQPQAIFAAISTNPLILLPCSFISGQGLVPQNGIINPGQSILLPPSLGTTIVDGTSLKQLQRQAEPLRVSAASENLPPGALKVEGVTSFLNTLPKQHHLKPNSILPNKTAVREDGVHCNIVSKSARAEEKSGSEGHVEEPQEAPLDLSVRKRKFNPSCSTSHSQRSVIKRRNSLSSPAAHSPPLLQSHNSSSPRTSIVDDHSAQLARVTSPIVPHSDASCSSIYGVPAKTSSMAGHSSPTVSRIQTSLSDRMSPLPPALPSIVDNPVSSQRLLHQLAGPTPKIVKHGNNVCKECNIVFYKYDNYLAHKKHYCAYRRQNVSSSAINGLLHTQDNPSASDDGSSQGDTVSESYAGRNNSDDKQRIMASSRLPTTRVEFAMDHSPNALAAPANPRAQPSIFRCEVCGVKFSTSDNLNAHQTYYCSRQGELLYPKQDARRTSPKKLRRHQPSSCGEDSEDTRGGFDSSDEWKCSYCETICPSLKAARRHLLTHTEIRGFCCTICGYRGNTIRGMRSHIYDHLNIDNGQVEDLLASSVVVDHAGSLSSRAWDYSDEDSNTLEGGSAKCLPTSSPSGYHTVIRSSSPPTLQPAVQSPSVSPKRESSKKQDDPNLRSPSSPLYSCQICEHSETDLDSLLRHVSRVHGSTDVGSLPKDYAGEEVDRCVEAIGIGGVCDVVVKTESVEEEHILPCCKDKSESGNDCEISIKKEPVDDQCTLLEDVECSDNHEKGSSSEKSHLSVICKSSVFPHAILKEPSPPSLEVNPQPDPQGKAEKPAASKSRQERNLPTKSELKYCKTCDISFHHLSNFIAHKKFYCVPRVVRNFQQETTPVQ